MKTSATNYMGAPWILDIDANGNVTVREKSAARKSRSGLPVFSTETEAQARFLVVTHCRLARDGSGIYTLNSPPKSIEELADISDMFATTRARMLAKDAWNDLR